MEQNASFLIFSDENEETFAKLAPQLAAEEAIVRGWGIVNVAQTAEVCGREEGCWNFDYFICYVDGTIGGLDRALHVELRAIWEHAAKYATK